jgi:hypothetical protein
MNLRRISIALVVLALVAGHAARPAPPPVLHGEQSPELDGQGMPPPHAQRSQKRFESSRREARRFSLERPPYALPPSLASARRALRVVIVDPPAAPSRSGRAPGAIAVARAPPGA